MVKSDGFDFAIRKDVRNNPIVRELDERRQRELRHTLFIGSVLVTVVLISAWQNFQLLQHSTLVEEMQQQRAIEEEIARHLRLEIETLRAPQRIEKLAIERVGMITPSADEAIVLERVKPRDPPASSLIAAR